MYYFSVTNPAPKDEATPRAATVKDVQTMALLRKVCFMEVSGNRGPESDDVMGTMRFSTMDVFRSFSDKSV